MYIRSLIDTGNFHLVEMCTVELIKLLLPAKFSRRRAALPLNGVTYVNGTDFAHRFACNLNRWIGGEEARQGQDARRLLRPGMLD